MLNEQAPGPAAAEQSGLPDRLGASVLDQAALARLAELDPKGESRLLQRVLAAFQSSAARLRPQLVAGRLANDTDAINAVAHTWKSASASIGAMQLSRRCAQVETAIRDEVDADLDPMLDALEAALDATLQAIDSLLKERG